MKKRAFNLIAITAILAVAACSTVNETTTVGGNQFQSVAVASESMIIQASDMEIAAAAVRSVGGEITHSLAIIRGVGALARWAAKSRTSSPSCAVWAPC